MMTIRGPAWSDSGGSDGTNTRTSSGSSPGDSSPADRREGGRYTWSLGSSSRSGGDCRSNGGSSSQMSASSSGASSGSSRLGSARLSSARFGGPVRAFARRRGGALSAMSHGRHTCTWDGRNGWNGPVAGSGSSSASSRSMRNAVAIDRIQTIQVVERPTVRRESFVLAAGPLGAPQRLGAPLRRHSLGAAPGGGRLLRGAPAPTSFRSPLSMRMRSRSVLESYATGRRRPSWHTLVSRSNGHLASSRSSDGRSHDGSSGWTEENA